MPTSSHHIDAAPSNAPVLIGAHLSTAKGLPAMLQIAVGMGAACVQIFTSSPQMWRGKRVSQQDADAFKAAQAQTGIAPVVSHDAYLINLASSDTEILEKSRRAFREEIERCALLGIPLLVTHLGAHKGMTLEDGIACLADSLNELIPIAVEGGVKIVLETTAGQGTYLGGDFAQFPAILSLIPEQAHLGICLDTCHVYVAGYDLRDAESYARLWDEFERYIGLTRLSVIHVNDTEKSLGSHSDRHAGIGAGQLGLEAFRRLLHDPRLVHVPKILETPGVDADHARNLSILRQLADEPCV